MNIYFVGCGGSLGALLSGKNIYGERITGFEISLDKQ